jgi:uncharacterized membrane protein
MDVEFKGRNFPLKGIVVVAVGLMLLGWILNTPAGLLGKADAVGYAVCHRIDARSFHLGERTIPLCARCSGMYLGAVLGLAYQSLRSRRKGGMPPKIVVGVLGLLVLAFGMDGLNSYLHLGFFQSPPTLYVPQNWLRLVTGTGMGVVIAVMVYPAFNQTIWKDWDRSPAMGGLGDLGALLLLAGILDLVVLTENPLVLYPLSLISAAGVLLLLTMVYTMVLVMLFRLENRHHNLWQLWLLFVGGFGIALIQVSVLDLVRYLFTGTWDGFHIG